VPLVPGTSWKGLFRARAGFILRTLHGEEAACTDQTGCGTCLLCDLFGSARARGRLAFPDSPVTNAVTEKRTHVAIDRVTGGARDKLLFSREVVTRGTLTLRVLPLAPLQPWHRPLLAHIVRDLHDGLIGVGGGTQRGSGTLTLTSPPPAPEPVNLP
jgi:CRISPR/Cas system CSM-associated protein Csm3 (group 7 of RAMP superfamily)